MPHRTNNATNSPETPPGVGISELLAAVVEKAKADGQKYLHCGNFYHLEAWPGCCVSCHEDSEEYGYELCSAELGGMEVECCCKVSKWLDEVQAANDKLSDGGGL